MNMNEEQLIECIQKLKSFNSLNYNEIFIVQSTKRHLDALLRSDDSRLKEEDVQKLFFMLLTTSYGRKYMVCDENDEFLKYARKKQFMNSSTFTKILELFCNCADSEDHLVYFANSFLMKDSVENALWTKDNISFLIEKSSNILNLRHMLTNDIFLNHIFEQKLVDIERIIQILDVNDRLFELFEYQKFMNLLDDQQLDCCLSYVSEDFHLESLFRNSAVMTKILENFIAFRHLDSLNECVKNCRTSLFNYQTSFFSAFQRIKNTYGDVYNDDAKKREFDKLIEMSQCIESFQKSEREPIVSILQQSDRAKQILKQIVENNLQDQYTSNQLCSILSKEDGKKRVKLNC